MSNPSRTNNRQSQFPSVAGVIGIGAFALLFLIVLFAMRSGKTEVSDVYGKRRGANGATESVNGTAVLGSMFEAAGHRVTSIRELTRRIDSFDTIVWPQEDFAPPAKEARDFLDQWLSSKPGRTLIYIGRDFNAAPEYWQRMIGIADPENLADYERREALARSEVDTARLRLPEKEYCHWFTMEGNQAPRQVDSLDGPWASGVDAAKSNVQLTGRLDIPSAGDPLTTDPSVPQVKILLQSENDVLAHQVTEKWWSGSKVIVVSNGSFLLNMPLVNKENRKLAGHLIADCGPAGSVAFLEAGGEVAVTDRKARKESQSALHLFTIWPISFMFLHFAALGIVFCLALFPIFGRSKRLPPEQTTDFGKHVTAIGEHLQRTRDVAYAQNRVREYQSRAKRKSGTAHRQPPNTPPTPPTTT